MADSILLGSSSTRTSADWRFMYLQHIFSWIHTHAHTRHYVFAPFSLTGIPSSFSSLQARLHFHHSLYVFFHCKLYGPKTKNCSYHSLYCPILNNTLQAIKLPVAGRTFAAACALQHRIRWRLVYRQGDTKHHCLLLQQSRFQQGGSWDSARRYRFLRLDFLSFNWQPKSKTEQSSHLARACMYGIDVVAQWSRHRAGRRLFASSNTTPARYRRCPCGVAWMPFRTLMVEYINKWDIMVPVKGLFHIPAS
jgi:hypothetical protein